MMGYLHTALTGFLLFLSGFTIVGTALPLLHFEVWWIRAMDFPRVQMSVFAIVALIGIAWLWAGEFASKPLRLVLPALLALSLGYQLYRIYPYTVISPVMSAAASEQEQRERPHLRLMVSNVLQSNTDYARFLEVVQETDPDILLVLEVDETWEQALEGLKQTYPHYLSEVRDDTYGMAFYSKFKLKDAEVRHLLNEQVPSVRATVMMPDGYELKFYGLHPPPPYPEFSGSSLPRWCSWPRRSARAHRRCPRWWQGT